MILLIAGVAVVALILVMKIGRALLRLVFGLVGITVILGVAWWLFRQH